MLWIYSIHGTCRCCWELSDLTQHRSRMPRRHFKQSPKLHIRNKTFESWPSPHRSLWLHAMVNAEEQIHGLCVRYSPSAGVSPSADSHCRRTGGTKTHSSRSGSGDLSAEAPNACSYCCFEVEFWGEHRHKSGTYCVYFLWLSLVVPQE